MVSGPVNLSAFKAKAKGELSVSSQLINQLTC
jgi:hypothetical protein